MEQPVFMGRLPDLMIKEAGEMLRESETHLVSHFTHRLSPCLADLQNRSRAILNNFMREHVPDVSTWLVGLYLIRLQGETNSETVKVLVE